MKQALVDTWSTREQLALASAVQSSGDQNWVAVSRAIRVLSIEGIRPNDWYSTKNCALQYAGLLEGVTPSKRKRDKVIGSSADSSTSTETPGEMLSKMLSRQHLEELSELITEERSLYSQLKRELHQLEAGHLDHQLQILWDQMVKEEQEEKAQQEKYDAWAKEREDAITALQQAIKGAKGVGVVRKSIGVRVGGDSPSTAATAAPTTTVHQHKDGIDDVTGPGSSPLLSSLLTRTPPPPSSSAQETGISSVSSVVQSLFSDSQEDEAQQDKTDNTATLLTPTSSQLPSSTTVIKSNDSSVDDGVCSPDARAIDDRPKSLVNGTLIKTEKTEHTGGKIERIDTDSMVIKEDTMIISTQPEKECQSSQPSGSKDGYLAILSPKHESKNVWDDMKSCGEVFQLGEVQRKYSRLGHHAKYDYSKDRKETIKLEKDSDPEELEEDCGEEEDEEDGGFAGFGPSSMSIGSRKIGSVMSTPKTTEEEDVYDIDNDDTIGIEATKKQRLLQHQVSKCSSIESEDGMSTPRDSVVPVKTEPPPLLGSPKNAPTLDELDNRQHVTTAAASINKKTLKMDERSIDFDDCDSVDSLVTNRSSVCDSDQASGCLGRGVKRRQPDHCSPSPQHASLSPLHFSDASPDSPASYGDEPETEKSLRRWRKSIMILWNEIAAHKFASVFLRPITEDRVPGYHSVVRRPMDLLTIKRHIQSGVLRTTEEFQRDVMLMCTNAIIYNVKGHNVYDMATHLMTDALAKIEARAVANC